MGLLGMYFDAVVVEVKTFFTFFQIGTGHLKGRQIQKQIALFLHHPKKMISYSSLQGSSPRTGTRYILQLVFG